jgi:subtilisin family serine protease
MPPHPHARRSRTRATVLVAAAALPLLATALHVPALAATDAPRVHRDVPSSTHKVTLVTGDVVTLTTLANGQQLADVDRPPGAVGGVRMQTRGHDLYVVPDEAVGLLGADRLDPRLFDVTALVADGYDDAGTGRVPMIATYTRAADRAPGTPSAPKGSAVVRRLPSVRGAALVAPKPRVRTFWSSVAPDTSLTDPSPRLANGISKLWLDGKVHADLHESVPQIGAPEAWAAGYDGTGVTVALLDTGVDVHHPDLSTQISDTHSFVPGETVADVNGHGTHVASTIVGTGAGQGGYYKGVAPGARLEVGKVLGDDGSGQDSWILAGMQWAAASGAKVVNMSLGDETPSDGSDPLSQAVDSLSAQYGTLFVVASGNSGPDAISTPGAAAAALTVGAVDKADNFASFSASGPIFKTGAIKPDLVAPGVEITAARSQEMTDGGTGLYRTLTGTSMATPHVAGSAAIVAEQHPGWTGQQIKDQLMSSAKGLDDRGYSPFELGTGRVDVAAAVHDTVRADGSLSLGNYTWPHDPNDPPVTRDLTFTNDGAADVTLDLTSNATGGAITLGASSVVVPAGGKATVPVTGDPQAAAIGRDAGWIIGTDHATGTPVTRTSVALVKEDERYDLNVSLVDREGNPASAWVTVNQAGDFFGAFPEFVDGHKTLRLPPGDWSLTTYLDTVGQTGDRSGLAVLVDPEIKLHQSTDVVLDARKARLLQTTAPQRTEDRQREVDFHVVDNATGLEFRSSYSVAPSVDDVYVSPTAPITDGSFLLTTRWRKGAPMLSLATPSGNRRYVAITQPGSKVGSKALTARTVYAGHGSTAEDLAAGVIGKIVVVEHDGAIAPDARAFAAAAAGAKALIVVNDGIGGLSEYVGPSSIPVASVHRGAGADLIARAKRGATMTLAQQQFTPFVYDLTRRYPGQVPDRPLVYHPSKRDLARIDARYYAVHGTAASGYRYATDFTPALGFAELEHHPDTRVEWVTPGQKWVESHAQNIFGALPWPMVSSERTYHLGKPTRLDWFAPAIRPADSDDFGVYNSRGQDFMTWNVQPWSSSSAQLDMGGFLAGPFGDKSTPLHLKVWQGSHLIDENKFGLDMQFGQVPPGNKPYRVVADAGRPAGVFRLSTRTHTEWRFMSDTVPGDEMKRFAVLNLDYRLETDLHGDVKAGATHRISVRPDSLDGLRVPGRVTDLGLQVSYNSGHTWQKVTLHRGAGGWWSGQLAVPRKPHGFISLRSHAATNTRYGFKQEIIRAYGLR